MSDLLTKINNLQFYDLPESAYIWIHKLDNQWLVKVYDHRVGLLYNLNLNRLPITTFFSGSFNPLHLTHAFIINSVPNDSNLHLELTLNPRGKSTNTLEDLIKRIEWIYNCGYLTYVPPIIISKASDFKTKSDIYSGFVDCGSRNKKITNIFILGIDTLLRLIEDDGIDGINKIDAQFYVVEGRENIWLKDIKDIDKLENVGLFLTLPERYRHLSSTAIRKGVTNAS